MTAPLRDVASLSSRRRALFARLARAQGFAAPVVARAAPAQTRFPLTRAQLPLWLAQRLDPASTLYHEVSAIRLTGPLDAAALQRTLAALVARHAALRTSFALDGDSPVQVVGGAWIPELARGEARSAAERERAITAFAALPFDLERGPLARFLLLDEGEGQALLVVVMHHLVSDGASSLVLFGELATLYAAFAAGEAPPILDLPLTPGEVALEEQAEDPQILDAHLEHVRAALQGAERARLPVDRAPRAGEPPRAGRSERRLDAAASEALRALARASGATPFIVLLTAFAVALARRSGRRDLLLGAPFARRERRERRAAVGCFLVTLALRVRLDEAETFAAALRVCRAAALDAYAHRDLPLDRLASARDFGLDVLLNLLPPAPAPRRAAGLDLALLPRPIETPKVDLTLYARGAQAGALELGLVHDARRFDAELLDGLLASTVALLAAAARDPSVALWRSPGPPLPALAVPRLDGGATVLAAIAEAASRHAHLPAVIEGESTFTHAELDAASASVARRLVALGVAPGQRVALVAARRGALVAAILGVLRAGASFVLLDPAHPAARLAACLRLAAPARVLAIGDARAPGIATDLLVPLDLPGLLALGADLPALPSSNIVADDEAYVAFTSGSTGEPKGIRGAHGPLAHFARWAIETFAIGPDDRVSMLSGLAHDPLLRDLLVPLAAGAAIVVPDLPQLLEPGALADWLGTGAVSIAHLTPAMASLLGAVDEEGPGGVRVIAGPALPHLRVLLLGGDVLPVREAERLRALLPGALVASVYGATETPQIVAWHVIDEADAARARIPVGVGIDGAEILVLDPQGEALLPGEIGEIVVRSPHLALGYLRAEDGGDRFLDLAGTRAYRTGDLGRRLVSGEVELLGRGDAQVKIRGHRVEIAAVEQALAAHPGVQRALVTARPDAGGELRLVAHLVPHSVPPARASLEAHARATLLDAERPSAFVILDRLPLTPSGKIDRRALPDPALPAPGAERPRTRLERTLAAIWEQVLAAPEVGLDDDFFALGGHSLRAVQVLSRLRDATSIELPLRALFDAPTVRALALRVEPQASGEREPGALRSGLSPDEIDAWFFHELYPDHALLRASFLARMQGEIDVPTVERRLARLLADRPELAASFRLDGERPLRVAGARPLALAVSTLAGERDLLALIADERRAPFDLATGPLLRAHLALLDGRPRALVITVHTIALGAWSTAALARALAGR
jgi:amino acid adenylation domain-containing protein